MTWRTHVAGGVASLWLLRPLLEPNSTFGSLPDWDRANFGTLAFVAGLGALLPDLDAKGSAAKYLSFNVTLGGIRFHVTPLFTPAILLHRAFGHRGFLHSLLGFAAFAVLIGVPVAWFLSAPAAVALLLGWASHLVLDACTKSGVPLWWPRKRRVHLLPPVLRVTTGSDAEGLALALLAVAALALLLCALPVSAKTW